MNDILDRVNQQHSQRNRSRTGRNRQRRLLQPTITTPKRRLRHRRISHASRQETKGLRPNFRPIDSLEPRDRKRTSGRGLHVPSLGRNQAAVVEGFEIEGRGVGALDCEHGVTCWR